jgi:hypothetical protein
VEGAVSYPLVVPAPPLLGCVVVVVEVGLVVVVVDVAGGLVVVVVVDVGELAVPVEEPVLSVAGTKVVGTTGAVVEGELAKAG